MGNACAKKDSKEISPEKRNLKTRINAAVETVRKSLRIKSKKTSTENLSTVAEVHESAEKESEDNVKSAVESSLEKEKIENNSLILNEEHIVQLHSQMSTDSSIITAVYVEEKVNENLENEKNKESEIQSEEIAKEEAVAVENQCSVECELASEDIAESMVNEMIESDSHCQKEEVVNEVIEINNQSENHCQNEEGKEIINEVNEIVNQSENHCENESVEEHNEKIADLDNSNTPSDSDREELKTLVNHDSIGATLVQELRSKESSE